MKFLISLIVAFSAVRASATNAAYFKQFFYQKEVSGNDTNHQMTFYKGAMEHFEDWIISGAHDTTPSHVATVRLFMMENMEFRLLLTEYEQRGSGPISSLKPLRCDEYFGILKFNGNTLELWTDSLFAVLTQDQIDFSIPLKGGGVLGWMMM